MDCSAGTKTSGRCMEVARLYVGCVCLRRNLPEVRLTSGQKLYIEVKGGSVAEWFTESSTLPLSGFVLGSPEFNSSNALSK